MSDYSQVNDYSAKDALSTGNPEKLILGSDIDDELSAISTAIGTKYDSADLASQADAEGESSNVVLMTPLRVANWADYNAGIVGDLQALADPNADRILGWDDSAGAAIGFAPDGTTITTSGTTLSTGSNVPLKNGSNTFSAANAFTNTVSFSNVVTIADSIVPDSNGSRSLGVTGTRFADVYANNLNGIAVTDFARLSQSNTFTGATQTISSGAVNAALSLNANAGVYKYIEFLSAGNRRWLIGSENTAETGSNVGSNLDLYSYNDAGGFITTALTVSRATGNFNFYGGTVTTNNASAAEVGFKGMPAASDETPVLTDAGKVIIAGGNVTIPANSSVAYPVGTVMTVVNNTGSSITIAVTSDSMIWTLDGTTGTRTRAGRGIATVIKTASTTWYIAGTGLS